MTEPVFPTEPADSAGRPAVLVARAPERAAGLLALLRERGLDPVAAPVIERAPVEDRAGLDAARERLTLGAYDWVAITSVNAVDALLGPATGDTEGTGGDTTSAGSVAESRQRPRSATHPAATLSPGRHAVRSAFRPPHRPPPEGPLPVPSGGPPSDRPRGRR